MKWFGIFFMTAFFSFFFTFFIRNVAMRFGIVDDPAGNVRKRHNKPVALLGGTAIYFSFFLAVIVLINIDSTLLQSFYLKNIIGIFFAGTVILIGGILDDKYNLHPKWSIFFSIFAILIIIGSGIGIKFISNPFGGILDLTQYEFGFFWYHGTLYKITFFADILTFFWLLGMMYTTKILDGLDGLVSGITVIGAFILLLFSLGNHYYDPGVSVLGSILMGSVFGFFLWNWHPAKIFLGESGSLLTGFFLGILSIISGSKIAIAFLVMGIPILDLGWVIIQRYFLEKKSPFTTSDRKHLHFRLVDCGLNQKIAVFFYYLVSLFFGISALFFQTKGKLFLAGILILIMFVAVTVFFFSQKKHDSTV